MTTQAKTALAMALAFAIAVGTGALLSSTVDGGSATRTLPATDEPIPVLAPVAAGPDAPPFPTAESGGGSGGGGSGGGVPGPSTVSVIEPVSTDAPTMEDPDLAGLGSGGEPGDPVEPLIDVDGGRVLRGPHFEDPCSRHGAIECEARSIPSTVLGGDAGDEGEVGRSSAALDDPPPLWIRAYPGMAPGGPLNSRCSARSVADGELPLAVVALNPVDVTVEWREYHFDSAGPTLGTLHDSSTGASDPERRRWQQWFDEGTLNSTLDHRVQHCFGIAGLEAGQLYQVTVTGTDIFGTTETYSTTMYAGPIPGRPPTIITPVDDGRFAVRAAHKVTPTERVDFGVFPATGDGAIVSCNAAEAAGAPERSLPGQLVRSGTVELDDGARGTGAYQYTEPKVFPVHEGTQYLVCLWFSEEGTRSFDPRNVTGRESHRITSPNRYGVRIGVEGVTTNRDIDAGGIALDVLSAGPLCHTESDRALPAGEHGDLTLDVCELDDGRVLPDMLGLRVIGPHGRSLTYAVEVPTCPPGGGCAPTIDQWYELTIPNEVAVRRLCGGSCDPPSRRERAGTAHVHAVYVDGAADGGSAWDIGTGPAAFARAETAPEELPPWPRLDNTGSRSIVVDEHSIRVVWGADRPVVVHGIVTGYGGGAACLSGGDGSFTTTTFAETGVNEIAGLCANTQYEIRLELTDAAGESLGYGPGGPATWGGQLIRTPGFTRRIQVDVVFDAPPGGGPNATWHRFGISVDGLHGFFRAPSGCTGQTSFTSGGAVARITLGDVATVEFDFQGIGPCPGSTPEPGTSASTRFSGQFTVADLDRGVTIDSPAGDTLVAHATLHTVPE